VNVKAEGDDSGRDHNQSGTDIAQVGRYLKIRTGKVHDTPGHAGEGLNIPAKEQRHFVEQHVADDPTDRAGGGAQQVDEGDAVDF